MPVDRRLLLLNQQFRISKFQLPAAREAVSHFAAVNSQFADDKEFVEMARRADDFGELLSLWGWVPKFDVDGNMTFLDHNPEDVIVSSTLEEDTNLLGALAPFVEDGFIAVAAYHYHEKALPFWHAWQWTFRKNVCAREIIPVPWSVEQLPSLLAPVIKAWRDVPKGHRDRVLDLLRATIFRLEDRPYASSMGRALAFLSSAQADDDEAAE